MKSWTKPVAAVLAWIFWTTQAMPLVYASQYMHPEATDQSPTAAEGVRKDRSWLYGAAGVDLNALGAENVESLATETIGAAFTDGRALPLVGPGARSIDELVEIYAIGYERRTGEVLTDAEKASLRQRFENVKDWVFTVLANVNVPVNVPNHPMVEADRLARIVPIIDDAGLPSLLPEDVMGHSVTHAALAAHGGRHRYQGWEAAQVATRVPEVVTKAIGPISVYLSFDLIEGLLANGEEGKLALRQILVHDIGDAIRGHHMDEPSLVSAQVDRQIEQVVQAFDKARQDRRAKQLAAQKALARKRAEALAVRVQAVPYVMDINRFFVGGKAPEFVLRRIALDVKVAIAKGEIKDARFEDLGEVVLIDTRYNGPQRSARVDRLIVDIVAGEIAASVAASTQDNPVVLSDASKELQGKSYHEQFAALQAGGLGEFAFDERGAEPIHFSIALGGGMAAYNWPAMRLLDEAVQNQLKIEGMDAKSLKKIAEHHQRYVAAVLAGDEKEAERLLVAASDLASEASVTGPGYTVEVERISDIVAGKRERKVYRFIYPMSAPFIHTLVDDQTDFVITRIKPRPGSKLFDPTKSMEDQDPMVAVMVDRLPGATRVGSFCPIWFSKEQSGSPALGEHTAVTTEFYLTTAGPNDAYHRGTIPVTADEAKTGVYADQGLVREVSWAYMSENRGEFPRGEVLDQVGLSNDIIPLREDNLDIHRELALMGSFQPATTAPEAARRAEAVVEELGPRFHEIPAALERNPDGTPKLDAHGKPIAKLDPILEASNRNAKLTMSVIKADIGATGHQRPFQFSIAAIRASLRLAQREGLIEAFDVYHTGDDIHMVMFHQKGVQSAEIHNLAWQSFFRAGWAIKKTRYPDAKGHQLYGDMQDFVDATVRELINKGEEHRYANLTQAYIDALGVELRAMNLPDSENMPKIQQAFDDIQAGRATGNFQDLTLPGNVSGMGPGQSEKALAEHEFDTAWSDTGNDKAAAGAFNYPTYWASRVAFLLVQRGLSSPETLEQALLWEMRERMPMVPIQYRKEFARKLIEEVQAEMTTDDINRLRDVMGNGVVLEDWDVMPNSRAFLDAEREDYQVLALLSAQNDHNIKRLWMKKRKGWFSDLSANEVQAIEQRVDQELPALRVEYASRKSELEREIRAGEKKLEELNPWERSLVQQSVDEHMASLRPRLVEYYKVQEFRGDDYFMVISTDKLAAVTGGEYVGKDDSVAIALRAFVKLYRAMRNTTISVNIGNARGSAWVAMRPVPRNAREPGAPSPAVATKWSNPIETSFDYHIGKDGTVAIDQATGMAAADDVYGRPGYDAMRTRVLKFNERWLKIQGGFTPHGPHVNRDVEAAYPARKTRDGIVAPGSPFAHDFVDTTLPAIGQGVVSTQFANASGYVISPQVAEQAADVSEPTWIVLHSSVYREAEDGVEVQEQIQRQMKAVLAGGRSAVHFALAVDGAKTPEEASTIARAIAHGTSVGSEDRGRLDLSSFSAVVPATVSAGELVGLLEVAVPSSTVRGVYGPDGWARQIKEASPKSSEVAVVAFKPSEDANKVAVASNGIIAVVEAAVAGGKLHPELAARLKVTDVEGFLVPDSVDIAQEAEPAIRAYQEQVKSDEAAAIKG